MGPKIIQHAEFNTETLNVNGSLIQKSETLLELHYLTKNKSSRFYFQTPLLNVRVLGKDYIECKSTSKWEREFLETIEGFPPEDIPLKKSKYLKLHVDENTRFKIEGRDVADKSDIKDNSFQGIISVEFLQKRADGPRKAVYTLHTAKINVVEESEPEEEPDFGIDDFKDLNEE